jgi:predicted nucleotidyltransferase
MGEDASKKDLLQRLRNLTEEYKLAVLFGSYARGEQYSSSDIDLVLLDPSFTGWSVDDKGTELHKNGLTRTLNSTLSFVVWGNLRNGTLRTKRWSKILFLTDIASILHLNF